MAYRVGVDIGGTFTDLCLLDEETGTIRALKVLSTPSRPGEDIMGGVTGLAERYGADPARIAGFTHGTTVGINTIIQRKGASLALLTTEGFCDVLEIARLRMPKVLDLFSRREPPLIPRDRVFGVRGRILADGTEHEKLSAGDVERAAQLARERGAEGLIVAFLNAYRNPMHEREAKAVLARCAPDLFVFGSAEVWPAIREYERTTTAILNGYVHPRVSRYVASLQAALREAGVPAEPMATKSNGGVMRAELGKTSCVGILLSGTASGVIGASYLARQAGFPDCMTLDIGGTSADVAFILDGEPQYGMGEQVGDFPVYIPSVSVSSIGDGGGSIAWVDEFGVLNVGPESAGSDPGPACYGRGGTRPTVTDAFAALGFLGHSELGFGAVHLDRIRAQAVIGELARRLGTGLRETAEQIVEICLSGMFKEISTLLAQRGLDPEELTLFAFGGAGPMLGPLLARELGIRTVLVPPSPGVVSALGGLVAPVQNDFVQTVFGPLDRESLPTHAATVARLSEEALRWLREEQGHGGEYRLHVVADLRYAGQSFEIEVPLERAWLEQHDFDRIREVFDAKHEALYGFSDPKAAAQVVNLRVVISAPRPELRLPELPPTEGPPTPAGALEVFLDGAPRRAMLYRRTDFRAGDRFAGPAVVAQDDTTTCIPAGFSGRVDAMGNLILTLEDLA